MRWRNTLIMAVVALLLLGAVYFLEIRGAEEREAAEVVADRLVRFEPDDVTGLTIAGGEHTIVLARVDDEWRITSPYDLDADQTAVSGILTRLESTDHERIVEETPEDLGRFGLDSPEVSVTLELADGTRHQLDFGDGTPVGFNVFVKTGAADTVYTAAAGVKDAVNKSLYDLRDRRVLSFADADVERIEIDSETIDATVERQPDRGDGIDRWALTAPLAARADTDEVTGLLQRLRSANAVAFAADQPSDEQIAEFGLGEPQVTVRVWSSDDAAQTLVVGGTAEEPAGRYARRLGSDAVMIIPANLVNELPEYADALRNRAVVEFARDLVEAIAIERGGETLRAEKDGVEWRLTSPRPLGGDAGAVAALLTDALEMRAREFPEGGVDAARFGLGEPYARVSFELEALPGDDAAGGQEAETLTLLIGAAAEVEPEEAGAVSEGEEGEEPEPLPARYVAVQGEPTVYLIEQSDLENIDVDLFTLRSKTLVSFAQSDLTRLELITPESTVALAKDDAGQWTRDGEAISGEAATAVDDVLWRLNYLDMQGIVSEQADFDASPYGLAAPALRIRAFIGDSAVADVSVGTDVPENELTDLAPFAPRVQTYAAVADTPGVFRIDATLRDALQALLDTLS